MKESIKFLKDAVRTNNIDFLSKLPYMSPTTFSFAPFFLPILTKKHPLTSFNVFYSKMPFTL